MNIHKQNNEMDCCLIPCKKIKIDERHKCKNQNYETLRKKLGEDFCDTVRQRFLKCELKSTIEKGKN